MIRIAISPEAFEVIARTLPGSVGVEPDEANDKVRHVWLEPAIVDRLGSMRGPGEDYSAVILRVATLEKARR